MKKNTFDPRVPCPHASQSMTRRALLGRGLLSGITYVTLPSFVSNLVTATKAEAASSDWAFVQINGAGGPSIHGNFLPMLPDGSYPTSIIKAGVVNSIKSTPQGISYAFQAPFLNRATTGEMISQMAAGMLQIFGTGINGMSPNLTQEIVPRLQSACVVTTSSNDNNGSPQAIGEAIIKAGARAEVANLFGNRNSATGINQSNVLTASTVRSLFAGSISDIKNAVRFTTELASIPQSGLAAMAEGMEKLSLSQVNALNSLTDVTILHKVSSQTFAKNRDFVDPDRFQVDARQVALYQRLYGISPTSTDEQPSAIIASLVKGAMDRNFAAVGFDVNDCDYHGQALTVTENIDFELGQRIGQVLRAAYESNRKVFLFLSADGTNYGDDKPDGRRWDQADRGELITTWQLFILDPTRTSRRSLLQPIPQIGTLTNEYVTDPAGVIYNTRKAAAAVAMNFINLMNNGDLSAFEALFPGVFTSSQKSKLLLWSPT